MSASFAENAIVSKARGLFGKRITSEQFKDMAKCNSVSEVAMYLKSQTHFSDALSGISENNIHRGQLEEILRRSVFDSYSELFRYITDPTPEADTLFDYFFIEEEINEILKMLLLIKAGNAESYIMELPAFLLSKAKIDLMQLAKVTTYDELISVLGESEYAKILKRFTPDEEHPNIRYVACEQALFDYYFGSMLKMIDKYYAGETKKQLSEMLKYRIELFNITSIYRSKFFHNASDTTTVKRIYTYYFKLSAKTFDRLIHANDKEKFKAILSDTYYGKRYPFDDVEYIENYTQRIIYNLSKHYLHFTINAPVAFYAYYYLSQIELSNIISIIECVRYDLSVEEIEKLLIE